MTWDGNLSPVGNFEADTIQTTMQYYLKVFRNICLKDPIFRYNINIIKRNTVGLRHGLAAGCRGQKKEKDTKEKKQQKEKGKKNDDDSYSPEDDNESDDDDLLMYDNEIGVEEEHKIL